MKSVAYFALLVVSVLFSPASQANWSADWASREKITLNSAPDGVDTKTPVENVTVLIRLHSGNFSFSDAKPDGSDLRFIADDDKTSLKFHVEQFDSLTELALVWVTVPKLNPGNKSNFIWLYYNNPKAPPAGDSKTTYDAAQALIFHFSEKDGAPKDATAYGNNAATSTATANPSGLVGGDASFAGSSLVSIPASTSLHVGGNGITVSMWVKPDGAAQNATLFKQQDGANFVALQLQGDKLIAQANGKSSNPAGAVSAGTWHHVALVGKDNLTIYLDGAEVGNLAGAPPGIAGAIELGAGYKGEIDEFGVAYTARTPDFIKTEALGANADQHLVTYGQAEGGEESGGTSYFKILLGSVTVDGWVVIGILMVMMVISFTVMITKALFVSKLGKANETFKRDFSSIGPDLTALEQGEAGTAQTNVNGRQASSLYRIYAVGTRELRKRLSDYKEKGRALVLSSQSIDAIRASLDASMTRELQRMNAQMVLLTIAIAGGPFLGLLGTVVGVMITFAAIAAAGDVNVNSIAPGIAAALVATVAGLGVAIPSLFGYNYLSSRIKDLSTDMHVFVDEFVTRLAENYSD